MKNILTALLLTAATLGTPPAKAAVTATFQVTSAWSGGYIANLILSNTGTTSITNWNANLSTRDTVSNAWNGTATAVTGGYAVTPASWTAVIPAKGSVSVGFQFNATATNPSVPSKLTVNGAAVPVTVILPAGVIAAPTPTPTATPKPTATPSPTATPKPTATPTPVPTPTATPKPTATPTPVPTPTATPKPTATPTPVPTPTATPKPTATPTPIPTPTATPSPSPTPSATPSPTPVSSSAHRLTGYFPSWSDSYYYYPGYSGIPMTDEQLLAASKLAQSSTTPYTDIYLAFAQPNFTWSGISNNTWSGTGMSFSSAPQDVAQAIRLMHNAGKRVVLSVGGATYNDWAALSSDAGKAMGTTTSPTKTALAQFIVDMKIDGLDVDYEINGTTTSVISQYAGAIQAMREAVDAAMATDGRVRVLALAGWSTGADYTAQIPNTQNPGQISYWGGSAGRERMTFAKLVTSGSYAGQSIGSLLNVLNVMSYDAGCQYYDPTVAYDQYRKLLPSTVTVSGGLEIPPESWGGAVLVINNADAGATGTIVLKDQYQNPVNQPYSVQRLSTHILANSINANASDGLMVWDMLLTSSSQVVTSSGGLATTATPTSIGTAFTTLFGGGSTPLPSPTPAPSATPSPSATPVPSATPTATPVPSATPKPTAAPTPSATPAPIYGSVTTSGTINFHYAFGSNNSVGDTLTLDGDNYTDLFMANIIAGVMYGHLIQEASHGMQFDKDYLYGSILGQLLQENIATEYYTNTSTLIDSLPTQQGVMGAGQGGPYQINNYAVDMVGGTYAPQGFSLINYVAIQKNIGFSMNNAATQHTQITPASFNNKYYAPMLTAYFHLNDYRSLQYTGGLDLETPWSPGNGQWTPTWQPYFNQTLASIENLPDNQLDILMNVAYNAGASSQVFTADVKASTNSTPETVALLGSYTNAWNGGEFQQYPYQVRSYLDQIYNNPTPQFNNLNIIKTSSNHVAFPLSTLEQVFSNCFQTLAYVDAGGNYNYISASQAQNAFRTAMSSIGLISTQTLDLSDASQRAEIFSLLEQAIDNLESSLNTDFSATTQAQL